MKFDEKIFLSLREAAFLLGIGRSKVYELINAGDLERTKLGSRTLIHRDEIGRFAARMHNQPPSTKEA